MSEATTIAGVPAKREIAPPDRDALAAAVRELAAGNAPFAFVGGGTDLDFGNPPRALEAIVRTTRLSRVLDYAPEDQTITVEGGMTLAALDAVLEQHGQMVPIDVGDRARATVGGAIATNAFGSRRHRYGSFKDLIVGVEIVRPDGVAARGGGKVVKNVAGFDLPKLMVGSLGTLGAIVSATLRVFPMPEAVRGVSLDALAHDPAVAAIVADRSLDPMTITTSNAGATVVAFGGLGAAVDLQIERTLALALGRGIKARVLDDESLATAQAFERRVRARGAWRASIAHARAARTPACIPRGASTVTYPTLGVTVVSSDDVPFDPDAVAEARRAANVVFHALPPRARATFDAWGPLPPAFGLMQALKQQFDARGLCNPGRFVGGL